MCCPCHLYSPSPPATIQPAAHCQCLMLRCSKLTYVAICSSSHTWPAGLLPASDRPVQGAAQPPCSGARCLWTAAAAAAITRGRFEQSPAGVRLLSLVCFRAGSDTNPLTVQQCTACVHYHHDQASLGRPGCQQSAARGLHGARLLPSCAPCGSECAQTLPTSSIPGLCL